MHSSGRSLLLCLLCVPCPANTAGLHIYTPLSGCRLSLIISMLCRHNLVLPNRGTLWLPIPRPFLYLINLYVDILHIFWSRLCKCLVAGGHWLACSAGTIFFCSMEAPSPSLGHFCICYAYACTCISNSFCKTSLLLTFICACIWTQFCKFAI